MLDDSSYRLHQPAITFFKRELDIRGLLKDDQGHAVALCNLGHALVRSGDVVRGAKIHEKASVLFKDVVKDPRGEVIDDIW